MDREKDKDKDKDTEKEKEKQKSSIKSQLSETKENVKKLIGSKDKQNSKISLQMTVIEPVETHNNGDVKNSSNSPLVLTKRLSDIGDDIIDKSLPDVVNMSKVDSVVSNGSSHGILSPFEPLSDSDSDDAIVEHPHQQLSSSSSASINILMENGNNKMMGNVQVSQV
jgi:hypothetical protein